MGTSYGLVVMAIMLILFVIALRWRRKIIQDTLNEFSEKPYSYTLVIHGEGIDAVADKIIVNAGDVISSFCKSDFLPQSFVVKVKDGSKSSERKVTTAYPCNIDGKLLDEALSATHVALELESTGDEFEHPFVKQLDSESQDVQGKNKDVYEYSISHPKLVQPLTLCNDWWWQDE